MADPFLFLRGVAPEEIELQHWQVPLLQSAWIAHNGLLELDQLRRLVFMMEKYFTGIEVDLRIKADVNAGEMWRDRRWRELLNLIDHLPSDSHMNRLLSQDKEYMSMILNSPGKGPATNAPSMADWSQTNRMLADLIDSVNALIQVTKGAAGSKKNDFHPYPRPKTAVDELRYEMDRKNHEDMNAILLRDRPPKSG